jgi:protein-tyrosine-phosphatase
MGPIITVCTGNICRSPMAEYFLRKALEEAGLSHPVASAGIAAYNGQPASAFAAQAMKETGIDISAHRSRALTKKMVEGAELVLVMTEMHKLALSEEFGPVKAPILLWRENMPRDKQIPDPYGCDLKTYQVCRDSIREAVPGWVEWVRKQK